jgi:hypothetical protein
MSSEDIPETSPSDGAGPGGITLPAMIQSEIKGKSVAVSAYDAMIWKIRTGYAFAVYGGIGLLISFGKDIGGLRLVHGLAFIAVVLGFTFFFAAIDYAFLCSKLRVVEARDELISLGVRLSLGELDPVQEQEKITHLLQNAGERTTAVDWKCKSARQPLWFLYGGAPVVAAIVVFLLTA